MEFSEKTRPAFFGSVGRSALESGVCPYCEANLDEFSLFGGSDGRDGGFGYCPCCRVRFAWIDSPYECEIQEEAGHVSF